MVGAPSSTATTARTSPLTPAANTGGNGGGTSSSAATTATTARNVVADVSLRPQDVAVHSLGWAYCDLTAKVAAEDATTLVVDGLFELLSLEMSVGGGGVVSLVPRVVSSNIVPAVGINPNVEAFFRSRRTHKNDGPMLMPFAATVPGVGSGTTIVWSCVCVWPSENLSLIHI